MGSVQEGVWMSVGSLLIAEVGGGMLRGGRLLESSLEEVLHLAS
jgi:hypothetical protein